MASTSKTSPVITAPKTSFFAEVEGIDRIDFIESHIRQLKCISCSPSFAAETIANLTHLWVDDITDSMAFPETLEHLFVWCYTGKQLLPQVKNIYIEVADEGHIHPSQRFRHRIVLAPIHATGKPRKQGYKVRKQQLIRAFGSMYRYYERVPIKPRVKQLAPIAILEELWRINDEAINEQVKREADEVKILEGDEGDLFTYQLELAEKEIMRLARKGKLSEFCVSIYAPLGYAKAEAVAKVRLPYCRFTERMGNLVIRIQDLKTV